MASRTISPGGALLRSSRMFSVPPPLPRPSIGSDTGTIPHPTHLSITTPYASLQRGDWGLKRPLPLRSTTKTSTPLIRVESVDTLEHITEFRSSADHALTLQKWLEMDIPLTVTPSISKSNPHNDSLPKSVFEDEIDTTTGVVRGVDKFDTRWRFKGPWLPGQNDGEFAGYLKKDIRSQKTEFRQFLREQLAASMTTEAKEKQRDAVGGGDVLPAIRAEDVTDVQLAEYIKHLRKDVKGLYLHIRNFLDLAPVTRDGDKYVTGEIERLLQTSGNKDFISETKTLPVTLSPYAVAGPPKTHPSAGLSYSRTMSRTFNHPEFGPQAHKSPVEARIVMPKARRTQIPVLGVGGFVVSVPRSDSSFKGPKYNNGRDDGMNIEGLLGIDPNKVGGGKTWVHPKSAYINSEGKVVMEITHGNPAAVAVKTGTTDLLPKQDKQTNAGGFRMPGLERPSRGGGSRSVFRSSYGLESGGQSSRKQPESELGALLGDA